MNCLNCLLYVVKRSEAIPFFLPAYDVPWLSGQEGVAENHSLNDHC